MDGVLGDGPALFIFTGVDRFLLYQWRDSIPNCYASLQGVLDP